MAEGTLRKAIDPGREGKSGFYKKGSREGRLFSKRTIQVPSGLDDIHKKRKAFDHTSLHVFLNGKNQPNYPFSKRTSFKFQKDQCNSGWCHDQ